MEKEIVVGMERNGYEIELLSHDSVKIKGKDNGLVVYIDPWEVEGEKADAIFITHSHFDHCSPEDVERLLKPNGVAVAPATCDGKLGREFIKSREGIKGSAKNIEFVAVPAYNINKFRAPGVPFHPKGFGVGYVMKLPGYFVVYHAGDTDFIPEMKETKEIFGKVDVAFLPVSGTYVMTAEEAAEAAKAIGPKLAIPMHYGKIVGSKKDAEKFRELLEGEVEILL